MMSFISELVEILFLPIVFGVLIYAAISFYDDISTQKKTSHPKR